MIKFGKEQEKYHNKYRSYQISNYESDGKQIILSEMSGFG